jgi:hypothetical protein
MIRLKSYRVNEKELRMYYPDSQFTVVCAEEVLSCWIALVFLDGKTLEIPCEDEVEQEALLHELDYLYFADRREEQ